MNEKSFYETLGKSPWYHVGLASIFCAGLLLLFVDKVPKIDSEHFLPAIIMFGLGFLLLGYIEGSIFRKNFNREGDEKTKHPYKQFFAANIIWFIVFCGYLFYRGVL